MIGEVDEWGRYNRLSNFRWSKIGNFHFASIFLMSHSLVTKYRLVLDYRV